MAKKVTLIILILLTLNEFNYAQGSWKTFSEEIKTGKVSGGNFTLNFIEDNAGNLFLTNTKGNVLKFDGTNWEIYSYLMKIKSLSLNWCPPALNKSSGCVYFGSFAGIAMWSGSGMYLMTGYVDDMGRMIYSFGEKDRSLCVFENNKPIPFNQEEIEKKINDGVTDNINFKFNPFHIKSVYVDSKNRLWFGNYAGELICCDNGNWTINSSLLDMDIEKQTKREPIRINMLFEDSENVLWILTNSCVATMKEGIISVKKTLSVPYSIFQDSKKNIWIGYVSGISKFDGKTWQLFEKESGIEDVLAPGRIVEDSDGNIWFCSETVLATRKGGGLYKYDGNKWESNEIEKQGFYSDILLDSKGNLWCSTITGFYQYKDDNWVLVRKLDSFLTFYQEMYEDRNGNIWFGTSTINGYLERYTP